MLNKDEIQSLIRKRKLIAGYIDLDTQLTPNGFDLTMQKVYAFNASGALDFSNKERKVPAGKQIFTQKENPQDRFGWWKLKKGAYKIGTNETVNLPLNLVALAFTRTSLLRMGAFTQHGVWDAGFRGRAEFLIIVTNPAGIKLKENARVAQLVFFWINPLQKGYAGIYQDKK